MAFSHRTAAARSRLPLWLLAALSVSASACVWIDDFGKFKTGAERDASVAADAAADAEGQVDGGKCRNVQCGPPSAPCQENRCNPSTGKCESAPVNEGKSCFDDDPCSYDEVCKQGACVGKALDCSAYDDECSQGVCDHKAGGCTFGPVKMSQPCDDLNACTHNDRCDARGLCGGDNVSKGTVCDDFNACTGTASKPDSCDDSGHCTAGGAVAAGTQCDDDSECTDSDRCDGQGACRGQPVREGEACQTGCTSNTQCHAGACEASGGATPAFNPQCVLNFCGLQSLCRDEWKNDRVCQCGCDFVDPDCSECSARMCQNAPELDHAAVRWCNQDGKAISNCSDKLKGDGACDCGCQFADPDCEGHDCCGATGKAGCGDRFVEACVCEHETNPEPSCCSDSWTQACAELAVRLGCMLCP